MMQLKSSITKNKFLTIICLVIMIFVFGVCNSEDEPGSVNPFIEPPITDQNPEWNISNIADLENGIVDLGMDVSIVCDSQKNIHVAYFADAINENHDTGLIYCTNKSGKWVNTIVDIFGYNPDISRNSGTSSAIDLDNAGNIHIVYNDNLNHKLKYATNSSGTWENEVVDPLLINSLSFKLDSNNKVHIFYATGSPIMYTTNKSGSWEKIEISGQKFLAGEPYLPSLLPYSLEIDSQDNIHLVYYHKCNGTIEYATNKSGTFESVIVDKNVDFFMRGGAAIALDSQENVHLVYGKPAIFHATNASGTWEIITLIDEKEIHNDHIAFLLDSQDKMHVAYCRNWDKEDFTYVTNRSGEWKSYGISTEAHSPWSPQLAIDNEDNIHMSFVDSRDRIVYAKLKQNFE